MRTYAQKPRCVAKIAISATNPKHWVYVGGFRPPYVATNGFSGETLNWQAASGVDMRFNDVFPYYVANIRITADAVDGNRFYLYIKGNDTKTKAFTQQFFVSEDGGLTWEKRFANLPYSSGLMIASAKRATGSSETWVSADDGGLWRTTDGGKTFDKFAPERVKTANGIAFGPSAPGSKEPTLYLAGRMVIGGKEQGGVFYSTDNGATFMPMTAPEMPQVGGMGINAMAADPRLFGRVYIGTAGTGIFYSTKK